MSSLRPPFPTVVSERAEGSEEASGPGCGPHPQLSLTGGIVIPPPSKGDRSIPMQEGGRERIIMAPTAVPPRPRVAPGRAYAPFTPPARLLPPPAAPSESQTPAAGIVSSDVMSVHVGHMDTDLDTAGHPHSLHPDLTPPPPLPAAATESKVLLPVIGSRRNGSGSMPGDSNILANQGDATPDQLGIRRKDNGAEGILQSNRKDNGAEGILHSSSTSGSTQGG